MAITNTIELGRKQTDGRRRETHKTFFIENVNLIKKRCPGHRATIFSFPSTMDDITTRYEITRKVGK